MESDLKRAGVRGNSDSSLDSSTPVAKHSNLEDNVYHSASSLSVDLLPDFDPFSLGNKWVR